ncbi:MAG: hypothetical protein WAV20_18295 [Blastocatellia bacterium]
MKTCPVCALDLEDKYVFCPDDGSRLEAEAGFSDDPAPLESAASESDQEAAGAVVLYCQTCAAEYPLTFSECPVHGARLTKHRIPRTINRDSIITTLLEPNDESTSPAEPELKQREAGPSDQLTRVDLARPHIESPRRPPVIATTSSTSVTKSASPVPYTAMIDDEGYDIDSENYGIDSENYLEKQLGLGADLKPHPSPGYNGPPGDPQTAFDRPAFRRAAIVIGIALAVFAIVALYTFARGLSRRPSQVARIANQTEAAPQPPFVPTPQEALDYKDEQPAPIAATPREAQQPEQQRVDSRPPSHAEPIVRKNVDAPVSKPVTPPSTPIRTTQVSNPPVPAPPRAQSGGFDARLVRVRSRRTPAGFRYELTFNMQEQTGRAANWQRVLISTRTASGLSHSEAVPFVHRLGGTGALTFTISVELAGRGESDWQGRVVCTTLGWDNNGAPLQASFGASVAP